MNGSVSHSSINCCLAFSGRLLPECDREGEALPTPRLQASMTADERRQLVVLEALHADEHLSQRHLAARLGVALGLANVHLKRLVREGHIRYVPDEHPQRLRYVITPKGITEEKRLRQLFLLSSLQVFRDVRRHLSTAFRACSANGSRRIAVYGTDEAAELVYLALKEQGLEPVAIFSAEGGGTFLGMQILGLNECSSVPFDHLLVANMNSSESLIAEIVEAGVASEKLLTLDRVVASA